MTTDTSLKKLKTNFIHWMQKNPMVLAYIPIVVLILTSYYFSFPINLFSDTEFSYLDSLRSYRLVIKDIPVERAKSYRYRVSISHQQFIYLYIQKNSIASTLGIGDTIQATTTIRRGATMGNFDYGLYLRKQHIVGVAYVDSTHWMLENRNKSNSFSYRHLQHFFIQQLETYGIDKQAIGTISALSLGYREDLDDDVKKSFQKAGAMHVLAVSGLHTGIVMSIILSFLTLFGFYKPLYTERKRRFFNTFIAIILLFGYAWLTGMSPSVTRSAIMLSLAQVAVFLRSKPISINIIAASALIMLLLNPMDIFSVSFQLSYSATLSIVLFTPSLFRLFPNISHLNIFLRSLIQYLFGIICVSLAAQIGTLPLTLYYFNAFCNYFLLTNLIVIPLAWLLLVLTIFFFATSFFHPLANLLSSALHHITQFLNESMFFIEHLPFANTTMRINEMMLFALYGIIFFSCVAFKTNSNKWHVGSVISTAVFLINYCCV